MQILTCRLANNIGHIAIPKGIVIGRHNSITESIPIFPFSKKPTFVGLSTI